MLTNAGRTRLLVLAMTAFGAGVGASPKQAQSPPEAPKPTGLLLGQVVDGSSGKPIGGALVLLNGTSAPAGGPAPSAVPPKAPRQVIADASGRFLFHDVAKGRYTIVALAQGYLDAGYGQSRPDRPTSTIDLPSDDEKRNDLTVRLWKSASMTGTILDETGEPIVDKNVRLFRRTISAGRARFSSVNTQWTDDRGVYRFGSLAPGSYVVGVVSAQVTMPSATSEAYAQLLGPGVSASSSELGRSLSSSGAPSAVAGGYRVGAFIFQTGSSDHASGTSPAPAPADDSRIFVYPTVYYPAAAASTQATVIELGSGEDKAGIDLQIKLVPTVRVSGVLVGSDGPAPNLGVKLFPGSDEATPDGNIEAASTVSDASGAFTFLGVTPGHYTLKCLRMPRLLAQSGPSAQSPLPVESTLWATQTVAVAETDVTGVTVNLRPGARISGRLVFDGAAPPTLWSASLSFSPVFGPTPIQVRSAADHIDADGRFSTVGYPPGRYLVGVSVRAGGPGDAMWSMTSAKLGGKEVADDGLEISSEDISNLVITLTDRTTELSGIVRDTKGELDKLAEVIVIPADSEAWKLGYFNARRARIARTSTTGAYSISNLPPGAYLIAAVRDETLGDWQDPKVLETVAAVAARVTLGDAEKKTQDLTTRAVR